MGRTSKNPAVKELSSSSPALAMKSRMVSFVSVFTGSCDWLEGIIFDYVEDSHPELYRKLKEALIDYIQAEYTEGDAVAESILAEGVIHPKPLSPLTGALHTDKKIWKIEVAQFVMAKGVIDKGMKEELP